MESTEMILTGMEADGMNITHSYAAEEKRSLKNDFAQFLKKTKLFIYKWTHWEYYPFQLVYIPMYFVWIYYAVRSRSLFFFSASNPAIKNGGFLMESKKAIYDLIPQQYYPSTILMEPGISFSSLEEHIKNAGLNFPLIAKPDIGLRGMAVKKINNAEELQQYAGTITVPYLIQEFIDLPNEIGIFYVRIPGEAKGKITGIVAKEFMEVTGDGISSVRQLIEGNPRYHLQLDALKKILDSKLSAVLPKGEKFNLVPYGNHCRGAKFIDAGHLLNERLEEEMNNVCLQVNGFYYGRMDLKYHTIEELYEGKNFSIIELNGAGSEPTHIYDPSHSIFFAWKEIARHFGYLYQISRINHRRGVQYIKWKEGVTMLKENSELTEKLKSVIL